MFLNNGELVANCRYMMGHKHSSHEAEDECVQGEAKGSMLIAESESHIPERDQSCPKYGCHC